MKVAPLLILLAIAVGVQATFAAQIGFSGRVADCAACHRPAGFDDAVAVVEGVPETWQPDATYPLTIRVEGGPPALPEPSPQGGFELEVAAGTITAAPGFEDQLRHPVPTVTTYEPIGTFMREWQVEWTAPGLDAPPQEIGLWLAVVSANGNHVVATNTSDQGEQGDASATLHQVIQPQPEAQAAWLAMPLSPPRVDVESHLVAKPGTTLHIEGMHTDDNATAIGYRVGDGDWQSRDTDQEWTAVVPFQVGETTVALRSEGAGRFSESVQVVLEGRNDATDTPKPVQTTPLPLVIVMMALWVASRR